MSHALQVESQEDERLLYKIYQQTRKPILLDIIEKADQERAI